MAIMPDLIVTVREGPPAGPERRACAIPCSVETREGRPPVVSGYASVFYDAADHGTEFKFFGIKERVMPGAFDRAIREDDVRALVNHDANLLIGRTKSGTARLSVDKKGLRYEADVPDTQAGRDLVTSLKRGDITGSSFAFRVTDQAWLKEDDEDIREIRGVELFDVSPVTYPAYESTTADVRALREQAAEAAAAESRKGLEGRLASVRARAVEVESG